MFCRNCQTIIPDDSIFCENCGAPTGLDPQKIEESNLIPDEAVEVEIIEEAREPGDVYVEQETAPNIEIEVLPEEEPEEPTEPEEPEFVWASEPADDDAKAGADEEEVSAGEFIWETETPAADLYEPQQIRTTSVPVDPVWWEPPEDWDLPIGFAETTADESETETAGIAEATDESQRIDEAETPAGEGSIPEIDETADEGDAEHRGLHIDVEELKKAAAVSAAQAKPYAEKAKEMLGKLGQNVKTGTEKAAVVAKEQFQQSKEVAKETFQKSKEAAKEQFEQSKEAFGEKKEQWEQQRAEDKRQKEIQQLRKENDRLKEEERRREFERSIEEDVIQQPGFWYGDEMPEPNLVIKPAVKVGDQGQKTGGEHAPTDAGAQETKAGAPAEAGAGAGAPVKSDEAPSKPDGPTVQVYSPDESDQDEPAQDAPAFAADQTAASAPAAEPELPSEEDIEDKLADTARFEFSRQDITKAVAAEENADFIAEAEAAIEAAREAKEKEEKTNPDQPALYRIQDFEITDKPSKRIKTPKPAAPVLDPAKKKKLLILIAIIVCVAMAVAGITMAMIHRANQREMAEEFYQASLKNAHLMAEEKQYEDAEALYVDLIEQRPDDVMPYLGLAQMYMEQQRYVDTRALIERATEATGDEESFEQMKKDIKVLTSNKWKKVYTRVLKEHEAEIRRYEDAVEASVAVCDVNGDLKPELFFFTREYYGYGKMHIYTTVKNKAKEVEYECTNHGTQYTDAFYDVSPGDSSYAIFNCSQKGQLAIYANVMRYGDSWDTTNEYKLKRKGGCKRIKLLEGSIDTTYGDNDYDDSKYMINEENVTYDKYIAEFRAFLESSREVILYNGSGGDQAVWEKVKPGNVMCMSYDDMIEDLSRKTK